MRAAKPFDLVKDGEEFDYEVSLTLHPRTAAKVFQHLDTIELLEGNETPLDELLEEGEVEEETIKLLYETATIDFRKDSEKRVPYVAHDIIRVSPVLFD